MTLAIDHAGTTTRKRRSRTAREVKWRSRSVRLFVAGLLALLAGGWGAIVPFVGPTFGFSADGSSSWYWNLSHALLALIPGAVGCAVGLSLMGYSMSRRRTLFGLGLIGLLAVASGAWLAIGPLAWPVLYGTRSYFLTASPLRELAYVVGYAVGPGLILAIVGGIAWGSETVAEDGLDGAAEVVPLAPGAVAPRDAGPLPVPEASPAPAPRATPVEGTAAPDREEGAAPPPSEGGGGGTMPA